MRPDAAHMGDPAELVRKLFHPRKGPEYLIRNLVMPHVRGAYEDLDRACRGSDMIVTHPLAFAGRLVAEKRGLAWRSTVLSPLSLMSCMDPPLLGPAPWLLWIRKLGIAPYRAVFELVKRSVGAWEKPLRELRHDLGLPPMCAIRPSTSRRCAQDERKPGYAQFECQYAPDGNLALFSRVLAEPQPDWPANTTVCGFSRYGGQPPDAALALELESFLAAGPPPIVFTLGSSVSMYASGFFVMAIEAARRVNHRALLVTGQDPSQYDKAIFSAGTAEAIKVFRYLPYSAVFPRAAVNVHQGGIGTLAQALFAGRPQLITPVAFDQPDNARRAARLGLSRSIAFQKLDADAMTAALRDLISAQAYSANASRVAAVVSAEEEERRAAALLAHRDA